MKKINLILAVDEENGLGKNGELAWHIKEDMEYFKKITSETDDLGKLNAVIMGRTTWESIPSKFRPLKDRVNCILTKSIKTNDINSKLDDFVLYFNSLGICILSLENKENIENIFVIGGASLYNELIKTDLVNKVYITRIKGKYNCDVFFDGIPEENFEKIEASEVKKEGEYTFSFEIYQNIILSK